MKTLRTLCSGGELFGVGAAAAGYRHLDGYEINVKIASVAQLNGFDVRAADVCAVDYEHLPPTDHLHASPSCKTASQANTDGGESPDDLSVADAIGRAIRAHQGATFTLENVWGYRNYESFGRICTALAESGFGYDFWHLNAADYGVPQTRKRLILIARRGAERIHRPTPTHRDGGDMFSPAWVGWYAAIADILHTLPPTRPAPWQEARMPKEIHESTLFPSRMSHDHEGNCYGPQSRDADEPALTLSTVSPGWYKAWIVGGGNTQLGQIGSYARPDDEPMFTVSASDGARKTAAAFLLHGTSTMELRTADEPAAVCVATVGRKAAFPKAYLLDRDNASHATGEPTVRAADEPAMTMRGTRTPAHRAYVGRWVRMTIQALGRFQTVPDSYQGLTSEINGNGVPCLLAQRIMESI